MTSSARRAGVLIFWDYDTQWGADRSRSGGGAKTWGGLEFPNTEQLLKIHAHYHVPACFAVVGAAAQPGARPYHDPAQIREIHANGHEVASHSFRHDWLPGLSRQKLVDDLRRSKAALEDCLSYPVVSFVPPFNQPRDYPSRLSISLEERRKAGKQRTGLRQLCECLYATGFRFGRISYRPLPFRLFDWATSHRRHTGAKLEVIEGVSCLRTNTEGGFAAGTTAVLDHCVREGGLVVAAAHPHGLSGSSSQSRAHLERFLGLVNEYRSQGKLDVLLPRQLLEGQRGQIAC